MQKLTGCDKYFSSYARVGGGSACGRALTQIAWYRCQGLPSVRTYCYKICCISTALFCGSVVWTDMATLRTHFCVKRSYVGPADRNSAFLKTLRPWRWQQARRHTVAYPGILLWGGVQQIHLRTEDRENGIWGR